MPGSENTEHVETVGKNGKWSLAAVSGLAVLLAAACSSYFLWPRLKPFFVEPRMDVAEYRKPIIGKMNQLLRNKDHVFRKLVEGIHPTVKVTRARALSCKVTTKDGTNFVGKNGRNVKKIDILVEVRHTGLLGGIGETLLDATFENIDDKLLLMTDCSIIPSKEVETTYRQTRFFLKLSEKAHTFWKWPDAK